MTTDHLKLSDQVKEFYPVVHGLVLAGGKSERMGEDKSLIRYHKMPQVQHTYHLLNQSVDGLTFVSCRENQMSNIGINRGQIIADHYDGFGPFGGILSAMEEHPEAAWLIVACDLPFLTVELINVLLKKRNPNKLATCFDSSTDGLPEPLCAIWEPSMRSHILESLEKGMRCPRKLLLNSPVKRLAIPKELSRELDNCNTPEQKQEAQSLVSGGV